LQCGDFSPLRHAAPWRRGFRDVLSGRDKSGPAKAVTSYRTPCLAVREADDNHAYSWKAVLRSSVGAVIRKL